MGGPELLEATARVWLGLGREFLGILPQDDNDERDILRRYGMDFYIERVTAQFMPFKLRWNESGLLLIAETGKERRPCLMGAGRASGVGKSRRRGGPV
jgi:hypothetical protein